MIASPFYKIFHDYEAEQLVHMQQEKNKMQKYFPNHLLKLQKKIEEVCDRMEYQGSPMFHQQLDSVWLEAVVAMLQNGLPQKYMLPNRPCSHPWSMPAPTPELCGNGEHDYRKTLVLIMLLDEIAHRRVRYFRRQREA